MLEVVVTVPAGGSHLQVAAAALEAVLGETLAGAKVLASYASAHHPRTREELDHTLHRAITYVRALELLSEGNSEVNRLMSEVSGIIAAIPREKGEEPWQINWPRS